MSIKKWLPEASCFLTSLALGSLFLGSVFGAKATTQSVANNHSKNTQNNLKSSGPFLSIPDENPYATSRPSIVTDQGLLYTDFEVDPFEVQISNERHGWTVVNASTIKLIDKLAHNDLERGNLIQEIGYTPRREVVYRKESIPKMIQDALESGKEIESFVLPGFAGEEFEVEVTEVNSRVDGSGVTGGYVEGRLKGDPDSNVMIGFYGSRESGSISSEQIGYAIEYDAREDNQFMVSEVDTDALHQYRSDMNSCGQRYQADSVGDPNAEF